MDICTYTVGDPLKIKIDEHLIESSIFNVKHDGNIDFLINQKTCVQEPVKVSVISRRDFDSMKPKARKTSF